MPTITKQVPVKLTPEDVAQMFCEMDSNEQARFFNEIAETVKGWDQPFSFQLQAVTDKPELTSQARNVMAQIGIYAYAKT